MHSVKSKFHSIGKNFNFFLKEENCENLTFEGGARIAQSVQRQAGRPGFDFRQKQEIFLVFIVSTQPPIQ
jgi:hypothetical protein